MYPWGKTPFPAEKIPAILLGAGVAAGLLLYAAGGFVLAGSPAADTETGALDMRKLRGVMFATLLMAMLLEGGLGTQVMVKSKGFKAKSDEMNAANRGFYNSLEHAIPAIIFIWTHAVLVNGNTAAVLGITYAAARFTYGFLYGMFGGFTIAVEPCTEFCYTLLSLLLIGTLGGLAGRGDLLASAAANRAGGHIHRPTDARDLPPARRQRRRHAVPPGHLPTAPGIRTATPHRAPTRATSMRRARHRTRRARPVRVPDTRPRRRIDLERQTRARRVARRHPR